MLEILLIPSTAQVMAFCQRGSPGMTPDAVQVEPVIPEDLVRVHEILEQYADNQLDFTDAAIIAIAERLTITRVYTLDRRDFSIIRPSHCDYFELFP